MEGMKALKASQGVANYDVNTMATPQEMRSYVCGQCHVEYYFKGPDKRLTFPWQKGLKVDNMLAYYDEVGHKDFTHKESGAPVLKAQHPEFEMYNQGIHAKSGVSCADCHMPYKRVGAMKISDHHVQSPMLNVDRACLGCHHFSEQEMKDRVEVIQTRFTEMRNVAMDALMALIDDTAAARKAGATDAALKTTWEHQRRAQFFLDFAEAENSTGFHAPQESMRILGQSVDSSRKGQLELRNRK
jgi:nitrite reductase (cytochrome c-552)